MHEERDSRLQERVSLVEDVERKDADESDVEDGQNTRCPREHCSSLYAHGAYAGMLSTRSSARYAFYFSTGEIDPKSIAPLRQCEV